MSPEARRVLDVFRARGIRTAGMIHPADFGDAIVWEGGFVRDAPLREALTFLFREEYLQLVPEGGTEGGDRRSRRTPDCRNNTRRLPRARVAARFGFDRGRDGPHSAGATVRAFHRPIAIGLPNGS